ncbi:uncharacterized protein LOC134207437 [Armigeres subalbatus]|uniref:uncharacterized protein LOC134207437 n=1 Tax=Armigeres subalbatus TaxID=124917 RepID=UPI002ECFBB4A
MVTVEEFRELKKQKKQLVGIINGIAHFSQAFEKGKHEPQIDVRLEAIEEAVKKFYSVRQKLKSSTKSRKLKETRRRTLERNEKCRGFYFDILLTGRRKLFECGPTLQETVFGWVVSGRVPKAPSIVPAATSYVSSTADLQEMISRFWELDACHVNRTHSVEEAACEEVFTRTTVRDQEGRFVVTLPKKDHMLERLGESRSIAMKRFIGLEKRFSGNKQLKEAYKEFIHEYILMGHMKEVDGEQVVGNPVYYMPHHAVLRPESTTTKLRVVFDASCKTSSGISLNDALMVGPVVQNDLISTILRFRLNRIAVTADVAKMYRMVRVQEEDQGLQRILWRDTPEEPVKTFELLTVTYGTASASYLATRCVKKLGEDNSLTHPRGLLCRRHAVRCKHGKRSSKADDGSDSVDRHGRFHLEKVEFELSKATC